MENNLDRALGMVVVDVDGGEDAMGPGTVHDFQHGLFMTDKATAFAFERFEDEGFEIAEVIVDDAVDLARVGVAVVMAVV